MKCSAWIMLMGLVCAAPQSASQALAQQPPAGTPAVQEPAQKASERLDSTPSAKGFAVPGADYEAGFLHRFLFGTSYRDLWTVEVEAELLDLEGFGGGLTPTGTGGGKQTLSLRFKGNDGRPYTFRALNKNPAETLPEDLQDSYAKTLFQDQISSSFPTGHLIVPPLLDSVGVLNSKPRLVVLPDSPLLGEWRDTFAGQIGMMEEWPNEGPENTPGFAGATDIISTEELWERLKSDSKERIAAEEYLRVRLIDLLVGDWDRHRGQLRWANLGEGTPPSWRPIPEDRDQAFARYDGLILSFARASAPQLVKFGDDYSGILGASWNGRDVDRVFLTGLSRERWQQVAKEVQGRLTDELIHHSVSRLPQRHYDLMGAELIADLKARRDAMLKIADRFYEHLATEVDIKGTDDPEYWSVIRHDGSIEVTVWPTGAEDALFYRRFSDNETNDVRLFLAGGNDEVSITGAGKSDVFVHIISDNGVDLIEDHSQHLNTKVYDHRSEEDRASVTNAVLDARPYDPPKLKEGVVPPRDWGGRGLFLFGAGFTSDHGLLLSGNYTHQTYGFRKKPFSRETRLGLTLAPREESARGEVQVQWYRTNSERRGTLRAFASGIEVIRYYGIGNDTKEVDSENFHKVRQTQLMFEPSVTGVPWKDTQLDVGLAAAYAATEDDLEHLIGQHKPYGYEDFGLFKVRTDLLVDKRDRKLFATRGYSLAVGGSYIPKVWSSKDHVTSLHGEAAGFLTMGDRITLAVRAAGKKLWGRYPFHEAAFLGGLESLRGYQKNRFAGDAYVFTNTELRLALGKFFLLLPNHFGLVGLVDTGRVFVENETSSKWHPSVGGGLWVAPLNRENAAILGMAWSEDDTRIYFQFGFGY